MLDPLATLEQRFRAALDLAYGEAFGTNLDPALRRSQARAGQARPADYQADFALRLAGKAKLKPRDVAQAVLDKLDLAGIAEHVEIAGPGYINITLARPFLEERVTATRADRASIEKASSPETIVIDYSSPNVAKEMHVGHLRSSILGDSLARTFEFLGHRVIRQNHLGDWGTPFGMLIEHLEDLGQAGGERAELAATQMSDWGGFYRSAREKFDADPAFAERSRARVVALQGGDAATLASWQKLIDISVTYFQALYTQLGVTLTPADVRGESFYNPLLPAVVTDLTKAGLAVPSDGALCVFVEGFTNRDGEPLPLIVQKQDGGFGYAATDLAAIRYRAQDLKASRLLYVVGAPQQQHFAMVFDVAKRAGWLGQTTPVHVAFGAILGPDRKMFKTRSGENVLLKDLVDEAAARGLSAIREKNPDLAPEVAAEMARHIGVGAIKYADLSSDRIKDYVFDWDRMLTFEGNTGPYLMYAHARIKSILRRVASEGHAAGPDAKILLEAPAERALGLELVETGGVLRQVIETLHPHRLCTHLHEVAMAFTSFYESCPVLRAETAESRASRILLCEATAQVLSIGLDLLGLHAPDQM